MGCSCSLDHTCSHHSQHPFQQHLQIEAWQMQLPSQGSQRWLILCSSSQGTSCSLHSHCRICRHFHSHSFHHSKTFSDDDDIKHKQTTKDE
uniref:Uncharacterized protein n=1 Tax=Medicago truncatula TaxID=3880 RepID=I3T520_MEDTR|nr:unknown [Medicago truncatula]